MQEEKDFAWKESKKYLNWVAGCAIVTPIIGRPRFSCYCGDGVVTLWFYVHFPLRGEVRLWLTLSTSWESRGEAPQNRTIK